jgi:hypothetical protein
MVYERTGYAPWSLTREAGVQSATVDGTIQVPQYIQPTLNTGFVDEEGNWKGTKASDEVFKGITVGEGIPNSGTFLFPDTNEFPSIDMTGFNELFIAIKTTGTGAASISAVMGPDTTPFANLTPVNAGIGLKYLSDGLTTTFQSLLDDSSENIVANVWTIFSINRRGFAGQKNLQFKITNSNMGSVNLEGAFMRLV